MTSPWRKLASHAADLDDAGHDTRARLAPVRAATTANITIATALNNADVLDGVTLATGDRVLVKNQSTGSQNGIYVVAASPARATDFDSQADILGAVVVVLEGTANADTMWLCTTNATITVGTTALVFAAAGGGGTDDQTAAEVPFTPAAGIAATDVQAAIVEDAGDLAAHLADATDAHDASAVSVVPFATIAATTVQAALEEIVAEVTAGADDQTAAEVPFTPAAGIAATDVQAAIVEDAGDLAAHLADATAAHAASAIGFTPNGSIAATDVQAAIQEVRDEASGGAGALVLLQQLTASASATLDFTTCISSTYDDYLIELINLLPATTTVALWMRMSTDGGSTYDAGTNYGWNSFVMRAGGTGSAGAESAATKIQVGFSADMVNTAAFGGLTGTLHLYAPGSTTANKRVLGQVANRDASFNVQSAVQGIYLSTTAVNAFRFMMSSGNITSGTIRVYGVAK